ncbi:helix-turn-helix transcriptional regulator [uncultured Aquimarina sp.]|uniref:helix-turn-helix transcriptional regulator n=1 Tax=uncultured Aquimarina sp. TaxID=575652 RepID=UPI002626B9FB|nr:helix-turn-helix transcriptional regulator [uncultured Aquimarina sp.]
MIKKACSHLICIIFFSSPILLFGHKIILATSTNSAANTEVKKEELKFINSNMLKNEITPQDTFIKSSIKNNSPKSNNISTQDSINSFLSDYGRLMFYYYNHKSEDSCLYYAQKTHDLIINHSSSITAQRKVKAYHHQAYILEKYYGYNPKIINLYEQGYELATKINDIRGIMYISLQRFDLTLQNNPNKEDLDVLLHEMLIFQEKFKDQPHYADRIKRMMVSIYVALKDYKTAQQWIHKTKSTTKHYDKILAKKLYSYFLYKTDSIDKAIQTIKTPIKLFKDSIAYGDDLAHSYYYNFLFYKEIKQNNLALQSLEDAINTSLSRVSKVIYIDSLISYSKRNQTTQNLNELIVQKKILLDKINNHELNTGNDFFITKIKEKDLETKNIKLQDSSDEKTRLIYVLVILLLIAFLFILYYKNIQQLKKKNQTISDLEHREAELLANQVQQRENELQLVTIQMAGRVEKLKQLQQVIDKMEGTQAEIRSTKIMIKDLIKTGEDISGITTRLKSQYPGIYSNLKKLHSELSETEIKYCLLTKLGLSMKETGSILNVSPNTVKNARNRIKKKINVTSEMSLNEYLNTLNNRKRNK